MEFVSSDTNVGIDFQAIARLQFPFYFHTPITSVFVGIYGRYRQLFVKI